MSFDPPRPWQPPDRERLQQGLIRLAEQVRRTRALMEQVLRTAQQMAPAFAELTDALTHFERPRWRTPKRRKR